MGHGGRREGAGRPQVLSEEEVDIIGTKYGLILYKIQMRNGVRFNRQTEKILEEIHELQTHMWSVSLQERQKRFQGRRGRIPIGDGNHSIDDISGDIQDKIDSKFNGSRIVSGRIVRPYRFRKRLIKCMSQYYSRHFGKNVTPRMVETCIEKVRPLLKRLKSDVGDGELEF